MLLVARKDFSTQSELVDGVGSTVNQQITVRLSCRIYICILCEARVVGVELSSQRRKLRGIARIFEQNDVLRIQTYRPHVFVPVKKVLYHKYNGNVFVVRPASKHILNSLVCFAHEIVQNQKRTMFAVKLFHLWKSLLENYVRVSVEYRLVLVETVDYLFWPRLEHSIDVIDQTKNKPSLSASRRPAYQTSKGMNKRNTHFRSVVEQSISLSLIHI